MKTLSVTLFAAWLLASAPLYAAEEDSSEPGAQATTEETEDTPENETVEPLPDIGLIEEAREREESEDFVPSVRITEDLPVAFPVDI